MWLANRGLTEQDISCWRITSEATGASAAVQEGTKIPPGRALRFATPTGMLRSTDSVTLADDRGHTIDHSPELTDSAGDDQLWYLLVGSPWQFGRGRLPETATDGRLTAAC